MPEALLRNPEASSSEEGGPERDRVYRIRLDGACLPAIQIRDRPEGG